MAVNKAKKRFEIDELQVAISSSVQVASLIVGCALNAEGKSFWEWAEHQGWPSDWFLADNRSARIRVRADHGQGK